MEPGQTLGGAGGVFSPSTCKRVNFLPVQSLKVSHTGSFFLFSPFFANKSHVLIFCVVTFPQKSLDAEVAFTFYFFFFLLL